MFTSHPCIGVACTWSVGTKGWRRRCIMLSRFSSQRYAEYTSKPSTEVDSAVVIMYIHLLSNTRTDFFMGKRASDVTDQIPPSQHLRMRVYLWVPFVCINSWQHEHLLAVFSLARSLTNILATRLFGHWYFPRDTFVFKAKLHMTKITHYSPLEHSTQHLLLGFCRKNNTIRKEKCCSMTNHLPQLMETVLTILGKA